MFKTLLSKVMLLLAMLLVGISSRAQSDYSATYTSNVTLSSTGGTSAMESTIKISNVDYDCVKLGTGSAAGAWKVTVPSGTQYLHLHLLGWNNEDVTLKVTPNGYSDDIKLTRHSDITGNPPFTLSSNDVNTSDYYKVITFTTPLASNTDLTFKATGGKRFVVFGVNAEAQQSDPHTVTLADDESKLAEESGGAGVTLPTRNGIGDYKFAGWSTTDCGSTETTTAPTIIPSGTYNPHADVTLYPVYYRTENGDSEVQLAQTLAYDTWTYGGSTTDKTSYRLFHNGGYVESSEFDLSKLSKVIVYGGTFGGGDYNKLIIGSNDSQTWKEVTVSGSNQTGTNEYTLGTVMTGTGKLRVTSGSGTESSNGVRISKIEIYILDATTYYISSPNVATLSSISLSGTYTTTFVEGSTFEHEGLVVTASYADDTTKDVTNAAIFSGYDMETVGNQTVTVSYTEGTVTETATYGITVTAIPTHTVTWHVNGKTTTASVKEGADVEFPTAPADILGYKFVGWYGSEYSHATTAPEYVTSAKMGTDNLDFFAVFANVTEGNETTIELTNTAIKDDASGKGSYSDDYNVDEWTGRYLIGSANGTYYLQLGYNSSSSKSAYNSHLTTPQCSAGITSITIETNNGTASGRTFYLSEAADLGTASKSNATYGSGSTTEANGSVTISVSGAPTQINIYPDGTAYIASVSLTYGTPATYSNYTTSVATTTTITLAKACTDGYFYYGTFSSSRAFEVCDDIIVSEVGIVDGKLDVEAYKTGAIVPANTGVLVSSMEADTPLTLTYSNDSGTSVLEDDNCLRPTGDDGIKAEAMAAAAANCTYYRLSVHEGDAGFYYGAEGGKAFDVAANKAYLAVPQTESEVKGFSLSELVDAIKSVTTEKRQAGEAYNLMGQRVRRTQKGIVIVNGKKYINK